MLDNNLTSHLHQSRQQFLQDDGIHWVPIRHHSPACAYYLTQLLQQVQPDVVLIEGAVDFNLQLVALADEQTVPPVALYGTRSFYPLYFTSPEWVALRWGMAQGKTVAFIDLPLADKAWLKEQNEAGALSFLHESWLAHSEYVQKLVRQTRCRDGDELWERWFELREFASAQDFFAQVFDYCTAARLTYSEQAIADAGDAAREAFMCQQIALHRQLGKRCVVVTGGFHTYALLNHWQLAEAKAVVAEAPSWLVRYSEDKLDAASGYRAGMQAPHFYHQLLTWRCSTTARDNTSRILDLLALLEQHADFKTSINTAAKQAIVTQVLSLHALRNHAWPGLYDVLDGLQSVLIKRDLAAEEPLLQQARRALAGSKLGQLNVMQPPLPLVAELHQILQQARFKLGNSDKTTTSFTLKQRNSPRLALLYQCQFVELGFAEKIAGPDWAHGVQLQVRVEEWRYAWTPWVEARLVDLSLLAPDWAGLLAVKINDKLAVLAEQGLPEWQQFFIQLVLMNKLEMASSLWRQLEHKLSECSDCQQICQFLLRLLQLQTHQAEVFAQFAQPIQTVVQQAWQQLLFTLPQLATLPLNEALVLLLQVQEIFRECSDQLQHDWSASWQNRLQWLIDYGKLNSGLLYACLALQVEAGQYAQMQLFERLATLLDFDQEAAYQALHSVMTIVPHWLLQGAEHGLLMLLNRLLVVWDESRFVGNLPDLRLLFSHLDPASIEKISDKLCVLNGWQQAPQLFDADIATEHVLAAQQLQQQLIEQLQKEGLQHWMSN